MGGWCLGQGPHAELHTEPVSGLGGPSHTRQFGDSAVGSDTNWSARLSLPTGWVCSILKFYVNPRITASHGQSHDREHFTLVENGCLSQPNRSQGGQGMPLLGPHVGCNNIVLQLSGNGTFPYK